jgi:hypothetical protein
MVSFRHSRLEGPGELIWRYLLIRTLAASFVATARKLNPCALSRRALCTSKRFNEPPRRTPRARALASPACADQRPWGVPKISAGQNR